MYVRCMLAAWCCQAVGWHTVEAVVALLCTIALNTRAQHGKGALACCAAPRGLPLVASLFEVSVRSFVRSIPSPLLLPNKDQRSWEQFQPPPHGGASGLGSEGKGNKVQNASFSATRVGCVCSAHKISLGMFPYLESPTPYGRPSVSPPLLPSLKSQGTFGR